MPVRRGPVSKTPAYTKPLLYLSLDLSSGIYSISVTHHTAMSMSQTMNSFVGETINYPFANEPIPIHANTEQRSQCTNAPIIHNTVQ